jgi:L-threonylcarbamoyladenylate synthase
VGVESTIVGLDGVPTLLRPGGVAVEAVEAVLGQALAMAGAAITAPGQLPSHYAPNARVRLDVMEPAAGETFVGFGAMPAALTLSVTGDLTEAAANLFHTLRAADGLAGPHGTIAFAPIPEMGLGRAINDRLRRAAAPR